MKDDSMFISSHVQDPLRWKLMVDFDGPVAATFCVKVRFRECCI